MTNPNSSVDLVRDGPAAAAARSPRLGAMLARGFVGYLILSACAIGAGLVSLFIAGGGAEEFLIGAAIGQLIGALLAGWVMGRWAGSVPHQELLGVMVGSFMGSFARIAKGGTPTDWLFGIVGAALTAAALLGGAKLGAPSLEAGVAEALVRPRKPVGDAAVPARAPADHRIRDCSGCGSRVWIGADGRCPSCGLSS